MLAASRKEARSTSEVPAYRSGPTSELDVFNKDTSLSPGMHPSVKWPVHRSTSAWWVPKTSVVTTTERTFVVSNQSARAEWVNVTKGSADGDLIEVSGDLRAGDQAVRRATDEMRSGSAITGHQ